MNSQSGMAALVIIIILSAASLIIAVSVSSIGIDEALLGYVSQKGDGAVFYFPLRAGGTPVDR